MLIHQESTVYQTAIEQAEHRPTEMRHLGPATPVNQQPVCVAQPHGARG